MVSNRAGDVPALIDQRSTRQSRSGLADEAAPFVTRAWTTQDAAHHAFKGLSLWAMDGTTLRVPDSAANREHFGAQGYASGKMACYPQVRAVTLTAIPTHLVDGINFGRYDTNEMLYAKSLLPQIPQDSLTVFDKGFLAAEIPCGLTMNASNRHFLPATSAAGRSRPVTGNSSNRCGVRS